MKQLITRRKQRARRRRALVMLSMFTVLFLQTCKDKGNPIDPTKCQDPRWSYLGLGGKSIEALRTHGGFLYAGTSAGVFRKMIYSADTAWVPLGLESRHINALIVLDHSTFITSVRTNVMENRNDTISLYKTTDAGKHWFPYQNGFGGGYYNMVNAFDRVQPNGPMYAVGGAVAKSTDGGMSWRRVFGDYWNAMEFEFIKIHPNSPDRIWAGGRSLLDLPILIISTSSGESWQQPPHNMGVNIYLSLAFHPTENNTAYVGVLGAVFKTVDGGMNWSPALVPFEHRAFLALATSTDGLVYAAGWEDTFNPHDPQELLFYKSSDSGKSWEKVIHKDRRGDLGVRQILPVTNGSVDRLYIGTLGGGVYSYDLISAVTN